jgi:hypothetical protein
MSNTTIVGEFLIGLASAARQMGEGRGGRPVHQRTVLRWVLRGARTPNGDRVRLEAIRIGASWRTSREAIARFVAALTPGMSDHPVPAMPRTPGQRQRAAALAGRQLAEMGV